MALYGKLTRCFLLLLFQNVRYVSLLHGQTSFTSLVFLSACTIKTCLSKPSSTFLFPVYSTLPDHGIFQLAKVVCIGLTYARTLPIFRDTPGHLPTFLAAWPTPLFTWCQALALN